MGAETFALRDLRGLIPGDTEIFVTLDSEKEGRVIFPGEELEKKLLPWSLTSLWALIAPGLNPKFQLALSPQTPPAAPGSTSCDTTIFLFQVLHEQCPAPE